MGEKLASMFGSGFFIGSDKKQLYPIEVQPGYRILRWVIGSSLSKGLSEFIIFLYLFICFYFVCVCARALLCTRLFGS